MFKPIYWYLVLWILTAVGNAGEILCLSLPLSVGLTRAELHYRRPTGRERAILVLCPGVNGDGSYFLSDSQWLNFADHNEIGIVGVTFVSKGISPRAEDYHYYYAQNGTGKILLDGLDKIYGKNIPLLLYGFSGGAHFVARFVEWKPVRVLGWCTYSAAWWDKPMKKNEAPPGIVACGKMDERWEASLKYFWDGRELNKPWLWIELPMVAHVTNVKLEIFIREYFAVLLGIAKNPDGSRGIWVDIYEQKMLPPERALQKPCAAAWLPSKSLYGRWVALMQGDK